MRVDYKPSSRYAEYVRKIQCDEWECAGKSGNDKAVLRHMPSGVTVAYNLHDGGNDWNGPRNFAAEVQRACGCRLIEPRGRKASRKSPRVGTDPEVEASRRKHRETWAAKAAERDAARVAEELRARDIAATEAARAASTCCCSPSLTGDSPRTPHRAWVTCGISASSTGFPTTLRRSRHRCRVAASQPPPMSAPSLTRSQAPARLSAPPRTKDAARSASSLRSATARLPPGVSLRTPCLEPAHEPAQPHPRHPPRPTFASSPAGVDGARREGPAMSEQSAEIAGAAVAEPNPDDENAGVYRPCAGCDAVGQSCRSIGCPAVSRAQTNAEEA